MSSVQAWLRAVVHANWMIPIYVSARAREGSMSTQLYTNHTTRKRALLPRFRTFYES